MMDMIQIKDLRHVYGEGTPFASCALDGISLSIKKGEFVGVIGHTGSGKSTLIQHLNGILKPTSGQIFFQGRDIWGPDVKIRDIRFKVGMVFQYPEYQLFEETVFKDVAFGPKNMGLKDDEIAERVLEAIDFVGLKPDVLEKSPFDLSGGQKRRVAIAGVIAMRPECIVFDEPTAGLDPRGRDEILSHIIEYHEQLGTTVLFVTHSMEDIAKTVDRVLVMNRARLMLDGTPERVFAHGAELEAAGLDVPQITKVFMGLHARGVKVSDSVYTIEQAKRALLALKGRREDA